MHLLGTSFNCGLIHIWCSSEYLWQQDNVCGMDSRQTTVPMFMVMKKHVTTWNGVAHLCVFNVFFGQQWRLIAQSNKLFQALATQEILASRIHLLLVLVFSWDLLTMTKI